MQGEGAPVWIDFTGYFLTVWRHQYDIHWYFSPRIVYDSRLFLLAMRFAP